MHATHEEIVLILKQVQYISGRLFFNIPHENIQFTHEEMVEYWAELKKTTTNIFHVIFERLEQLLSELYAEIKDIRRVLPNEHLPAKDAFQPVSDHITPLKKLPRTTWLQPLIQQYLYSARINQQACFIFSSLQKKAQEVADVITSPKQKSEVMLSYVISSERLKTLRKFFARSRYTLRGLLL